MSNQALLFERHSYQTIVLSGIFRSMKHSESPLPSSSHTGHVKNGIIILDGGISLQDGQAVRVEPLCKEPGVQVDAERAEQVRRLQQLFAEWTDEDSKLSEEEADRLHIALEQNRGLHFASPLLD